MPDSYTQFQATAAWQVVDSALRQLEENRDVSITTGRVYVIGHVCRRLADAGLALEASPRSELGRAVEPDNHILPVLDRLEYRVDERLDDETLNALFARAWPNYRRRTFASILARSLGTV